MLVFDDLTVSEFMRIRNDSGLAQVDEFLVARALSSSLFTLRYEIDGATTGMLRAVGDGAFVVVICDVVVLPEYRRRGIGTLLMKAALDRISRDMPAGMWVPVMLTCSAQREEYYKKFGFMGLDRGVQGVAMQMFVKGGGEQHLTNP